MTTLRQLRALLEPGDVFEVTNHYITRPDHPCYGTTTRTVTKANSAAFYLDGSRLAWPKAGRFSVDSEGTIRTYGGGIAQAPTDLFLTLVPA